MSLHATAGIITGDHDPNHNPYRPPSDVERSWWSADDWRSWWSHPLVGVQAVFAFHLMALCVVGLGMHRGLVLPMWLWQLPGVGQINAQQMFLLVAAVVTAAGMIVMAWSLWRLEDWPREFKVLLLLTDLVLAALPLMAISIGT